MLRKMRAALLLGAILAMLAIPAKPVMADGTTASWSGPAAVAGVDTLTLSNLNLTAGLATGMTLTNQPVIWFGSNTVNGFITLNGTTLQWVACRYGTNLVPWQTNTLSTIYSP
jgi:hypothetical protein